MTSFFVLIFVTSTTLLLKMISWTVSITALFLVVTSITISIFEISSMRMRLMTCCPGVVGARKVEDVGVKISMMINFVVAGYYY